MDMETAPPYTVTMMNTKANFDTLKEGDVLRDTLTGEVFAVHDIDREQETCAIHCMRIRGCSYQPVDLTEKQFARCVVAQ